MSNTGSRLSWVLLIVAALVVGVLLAVGMAELGDLRRQAEQRQVAVDRLAADQHALREQVEGLGATPVAPDPQERVSDLPVDVEVIPGPRGERGERGPAPTQAEIRAAVSFVLADRPDLTRSEIVSAVSDYLTANPPPAGRRGADGSDGASGRDGSPGRAPTASEIRDAVAEYCSAGACQGERGRAGRDGKDGADSTVPGPRGPQGESGRDSTVPGPAGPPGRDGQPGPACPDGADPIVWEKRGNIDGLPSGTYLICRVTL